MGVVYLTTNKINGKKYIGVDTINNKNYYGSGKSIKLALKKYGKNNFIKEIIEESDNEKYLFEREKYWIEYFNAVESKEFYNMSDGGRGGAGTLASDESKRLHNAGVHKSVQLMLKKRKGKTYEEIYGNRSNEEKEKRRIAGLGKKYSAERIKKVSESLKGKKPWNKGLKNSQVPWNKGLINKFSFKIYHLITKNEKMEFYGKKNLENYIKNININREIGNKINVDKLISNKIEREFILEIEMKKNNL